MADSSPAGSSSGAGTSNEDWTTWTSNLLNDTAADFGYVMRKITEGTEAVLGSPDPEIAARMCWIGCRPERRNHSSDSSGTSSPASSDASGNRGRSGHHDSRSGQHSAGRRNLLGKLPAHAEPLVEELHSGPLYIHTSGGNMAPLVTEFTLLLTTTQTARHGTKREYTLQWTHESTRRSMDTRRIEYTELTAVQLNCAKRLELVVTATKEGYPRPVNLRLRADSANDLTEWLKVLRMWATALKQEGRSVVWATRG